MNRKKKYPEPYRRADSPYYCFTDNTDPKRPRRSTGKRGKEDARDIVNTLVKKSRAWLENYVFTDPFESRLRNVNKIIQEEERVLLFLPHSGMK
jgi:hypothetical protein